MKKTILLLFIALFSVTSCSHQGSWQLVWQDDFKGNRLDSTVWGRIDRGKAEWNKFMSKDDRLYDVKDGMLILRGMKNDHPDTDTATYITGGVWTKDRHAFVGGKTAIRARLHGARGAWPAFWMLPFDGSHNPWPYGGEVDIMERLNNDSIAYQTVHSHYTYNLKLSTTPQHGSTGGIHRDDLAFDMALGEGGFHPLKRTASQGQQKCFQIALKLAQFDIMKSRSDGRAPLLLLDDVFDKLDMRRVENLLQMVSGSGFGQIFITDSNKVRMDALMEKVGGKCRNFEVSEGIIAEIK